MDAAGVALQPGLGAVPYITRQKVAAQESVLRIGVRHRRHGAARAGSRILPRLACILFRAGKDDRGGRLGVREVIVIGDRSRTWASARCRSRADRGGLLRLVFAEERIEL